MDRLYVLDMPALKNFEADGKIIEYICDRFSKYNCDQVERTDDLTKYWATAGSLKVVPISSVEHTREWLLRTHEVDMKPIEIPSVLQKYAPDYSIMRGKTLLEHGYDKDKYFIKRVDKMKSWNSNMHPYDNSILPFIDKDAIYTVSELRRIDAEYRVFVYKDKIIDCKQYAGDILTFPEATIIQNMVSNYTRTVRPKAYTLDIAVTDAGTIPIEVHPFVACGLYGFQDIKLLDMWEKGLDWYIKREGE